MSEKVLSLVRSNLKELRLPTMLAAFDALTATLAFGPGEPNPLPNPLPEPPTSLPKEPDPGPDSPDDCIPNGPAVTALDMSVAMIDAPPDYAVRAWRVLLHDERASVHGNSSFCPSSYFLLACNAAFASSVTFLNTRGLVILPYLSSVRPSLSDTIYLPSVLQVT